MGYIGVIREIVRQAGETGEVGGQTGETRQVDGDGR